ncbi:hypothetical protein ACSTS3_15930 [Aquimarina muelleri]|uniref:hypothetical protein n=1 Tax=Aquimarina muelleri TaxID=279356 RepID=UPI003F6845C9
MKKTKIIVLLIVVLINAMSCGQNKKGKNMNYIDYKEKLKNLTTSKDYLNNIPFYLLGYNFTKSFIHIEINGKLFVKDYKRSTKIQGYHFVNQFLNQKRKQKINVKIYPSKSDLFDEFSNFRINLSMLPSKKAWDNVNFTEQHYLIEYNTDDLTGEKDEDGFPLTENGKFKRKINIEGLPYFEKEFEFEAEMPFENEALQNSKDLREIDSTILEQKVLGQYHAFINSVKNKDENTYWEMYYNKVAYWAKANFFTEKDIDDLIKEGEMYYNMMSYQPIENYELVFYDEGRLVCFESKSNDLEFKGKSPLIATAVNPNDPKDVFRNPIQFYFYMPKDSNELQIMY